MRIQTAIAALSVEHPGVQLTVTEVVQDQGEPLIVKKTWQNGTCVGHTKQRAPGSAA